MNQSNLPFSKHPGPNERHLKRRMKNPLFPKEVQDVTAQDILVAQKQDEATLLNFMTHFQGIVKQTTELQPNTDSEVILNIKAELDECYATSCAMPGDQHAIKSAISQLIAAIMRAVRKGAEGDPVAQTKLDEEEQARQMHNQLHTQIIIADLMLEATPIQDDELTATMLNESEEALHAALQLFSPEQISLLYENSQALLTELREDGHELPHAWQRFDQIKHALNQATETMETN